jgi:DNA-binding transcriptional LysR family regulator
VSVPLSFGLRFLTGVVADLMLLHPRLEIDYQLEDREVDLVGERFDVAIRIGRLEDSSVVARRIGQSRRVVVASGAYLARRGRPATPEELAGHECIRYTHQRPPDQWTFTGEDGPRRVRVSGRLESNNGDALADAAAGGLGLAWLPDFIVSPHVRQGKLQILFDDLCQDRSPIQLLFPARPFRTFKEELFADAVAARLERSAMAYDRGIP